ncbi:invasion associated locus B family protein [Halocynthiibacter namhaensis]|uniref:invasion associated locus B family protein n=1 Tax=Halocynthiibacter namhaensis TaxID=1290553 RepID=UPI00068F3AA6|nr:invasion associated locus B family protein [Halocynthiibacter namhaensis]
MQNVMRKSALASAFLFGLGFGLSGSNGMAEAQVAQAPSSSSLTETYGDWIVRCTDPGQICEMTQELRQQSTGQRVLVISVAATEDGSDINVIAPFGLDLSKGLQISIEDEVLAHMWFWTCLPAGCIAQGPLEATALERLKTGDTAMIHLTQTNTQGVDLGVSLAGFTAAWNRLKQL